MHWETDASERNIDYGLVIPIYQRSFQKYFVYSGLMKLNNTQLAQKITYFHIFNASEIHCPCDDSKLESLSNCGLTIYPSDANGNCFFHSVATNINSNPDAWSHLSILDKNASAMIELTSKLHHLFVQEILGYHHAMYEHFVQPVSDYKTEAEKFL